ncbi:DUF488 domain-containing protein [Methanobacterium sp.]|uniref:DUF488 domain-containing protein n=1 Tax=Methanobacterium sp. TaxID=2164 RepID=UPI003C7371C0
MINVKRITEMSQKEDGIRIMVENTCPREINLEKAEVDLWLKEIAPGPECYECLNENVSGFTEFKKRYRNELQGKKTLQKIIRDLEKENGTVTLLYCSHDEENNCAVILKEKLEGYKIIRGSIGRVHGG